MGPSYDVFSFGCPPTQCVSTIIVCSSLLKRYPCTFSSGTVYPVSFVPGQFVTQKAGVLRVVFDVDEARKVSVSAEPLHQITSNFAIFFVAKSFIGWQKLGGNDFFLLEIFSRRSRLVAEDRPFASRVPASPFWTFR